jgi:hypothetical protein
MKKSQIVAYVYGFFASTSVLSWEIAKEFTAAPIKGNVTCTVEKKTVSINFNPHGTSRDLRVNCGGFGSRYSRQELSVITNSLIKKKVLDADASQLKIGSLFYLKKVFYLVSIDPAVVISVPHEFSISQRDMGNTQMQHYGVMSHFTKLRDESRKSGLNYLSADIGENWINTVYLSSIFTNGEGAEVISEFSAERVPLDVARRDPLWPFRVFESKRFPGHMEIKLTMVP